MSAKITHTKSIDPINEGGKALGGGGTQSIASQGNGTWKELTFLSPALWFNSPVLPQHDYS